MSEKTVWISFDLGLKGDYPGMYAWLDKYGAMECGDSVAVLKYQSDDDLPDNISREIKASVNLASTDRVYLIWKDKAGMVKGKFINGGRKRSPWQGYGQANLNQGEDY